MIDLITSNTFTLAVGIFLVVFGSIETIRTIKEIRRERKGKK